MQYFCKFVGLWNNTLADKKNPKLLAIVFKDKDLENNAKLEHQEKYADKIIAWTKNNVKYKDYIGCMCFSHI